MVMILLEKPKHLPEVELANHIECVPGGDVSACEHRDSASEWVFGLHLEVAPQVHHRLICLGVFLQPDHHQFGAFINVLLGFQDVGEGVYMTDNPSSFAMGPIVGLGEGTELSTSSVMYLMGRVHGRSLDTLCAC